MNLTIRVILITAIIFVSSIAMASDYTFNYTENGRFLKDLNSYTLKAPEIVFYGKSAEQHLGRTGQSVTFMGRGPYNPALGGSGYAANYVIVGHPCVNCTPLITRYHVVSDGPDEIIAVYPAQQ